MTLQSRAYEIFKRATDISKSEVEDFLASECGQDVELRKLVEELLAAEVDASDLLPEGTSASLIDVAEHVNYPDKLLQTMIGPYKLQKQLGEGGFGVVYMATQQKPVRREVAVKILKPGMDSRKVIARFESERQALALMDHPNISRVFDAGQTENGRPYFVMELVKGVPITQFCDKHNLNTTERLQLFISVCHAVQHAHQKGVIHRDLKPSNIMVTLDGVPTAKVIDFGVSKSITQRLTEKTLFTQMGQMIGTPQYMSPEQAEMSGLDVDTRSDIYSLGVVLYELLTGTTPLDAERLRTAGYGEMQRIIQEEEPPKPSTRISTLGRDSTAASKRRQKDPRRLRHTIQGDLDWIVMKALEKRRDRRYETANGLALDIKRHLNNETVVARPPSAAYKIQKAWRRNKVVFSATGLVFAALSIGLIASLLSLAEASRQQEIAEIERDGKEKERVIADEARRNAEAARKLSEAETARADSRLYMFQVTRAAAALEENRDTLMREMLEGCATELRGWEWHWLNGLTERSQKTLRGHTAPIHAAAFSPDDRRVVSGSFDQTLKLWDAITGKELKTLSGHTADVLAVAYSPDGDRVVSGSSDQTLKLWDAITGQKVKTLAGHTAPVLDVAFSPDGKMIVSGSSDQTLKLWDVATGKVLNTLSEHTGDVVSVRFNQDGSRIMSASSDQTFKLWDAVSGRPLQTLEDFDQQVSRVAVNSEGTQIVLSSVSELPKLWDLQSGKEARQFTNQKGRIWKGREARPSMCAVAFSPDASRVVSSNGGHTLTVWDVRTDEALATLRGHKDFVLCLDFNHDGTRIVSGSTDYTLKLWNANDTGQDVLTMNHSEGQMRSVAFSPDSRQLASVGFDGTVRIWNTADGQPLRVLEGHEGWTLAVAYSPEGSLIVSGGQDNTLRLWDAGTGRHLRTMHGHNNMVNHVAFSPNGKQIASSGYGDLTVRIWDVASGTETLTIPAVKGVGDGDYVAPEGNVGRPRGNVEGVAFSPDGKCIAASVHWRNNMVKLWDAETGDELLTLSTPIGPRTVAFSPNGTRLGTACVDGSSHVWDVETGEEVLMLSGHAGRVTAVAFSPDGRRIFTSSLDGSVKVWHAQTGEELLTLHCLALWGLAISPDGRMIAGATDGSQVKLWKTTSPR